MSATREIHAASDGNSTIACGLFCSASRRESATTERPRASRSVSGAGADCWFLADCPTPRCALVAKIDPVEVAGMATGQVKDLYRGSMLPVERQFPFHVVAVDGKYQTLNRNFHPKCTRQHHADGKGYSWKLGFLRAVLVSSSAKVCLKVSRIPKGSNEMSSFSAFFESLNADFPSDSFFEVLTLDAGFASRENLNAINERGRGFVCALKGNQPDLAFEAGRLFDADEAAQQPEWTSPWRRETEGGQGSPHPYPPD